MDWVTGKEDSVRGGKEKRGRSPQSLEQEVKITTESGTGSEEDTTEPGTGSEEDHHRAGNRK